MKATILTVSDRAYRGGYEDRSGPAISQVLAEASGWEIVASAVVPDEIEAIARQLVAWSDDGVGLILTTGGTGFAPRDVTPEATERVITRKAPGIAEALRADSLRVTPHGMLSRGVAGLRDQTLIVNLPGNPKAVREGMALLLPVLPHALALLSESPGSSSGHELTH